MFINNFDPVAIHFFSIEIRWYSLSYIIGILFGWILGKKIFITEISIKEKFDDFITYIIIVIIIGLIASYYPSKVLTDKFILN